MLAEDFQQIVKKGEQGRLREGYVVNQIKEYLQNIILEYIYNSKPYNETLVFMGGTCLRFCFALPRLSEDLDFDTGENFDPLPLAKDLKNYFKTKLLTDVDFSIKGKEKKLYLKFPILQNLGLTFYKSNLLFLKIEVTQNDIRLCKVEPSMIEKNGKTYFLRRYSLPDLMAGKIHAFLTRVFYKGKKNEIDFKGRDIFDLAWYMGKNIVPGEKKLGQGFKETKYAGLKLEELLNIVLSKAKTLKKEYIERDLINFIEDPSALENFFNNYIEIIELYCKKNCKNL